MQKPQRMSVRGRGRGRCNHPVYRTEEKCYSGLAVNCCNVRASTQVVTGGRLRRFCDNKWHRAPQVRCQVFTGFESDICLIRSEYATSL